MFFHPPLVPLPSREGRFRIPLRMLWGSSFLKTAVARAKKQTCVVSKIGQ